MNRLSEPKDFYLPLDTQVLRLASTIKLLANLSWGDDQENAFIADYQRGNARPPLYIPKKLQFTEERKQFDQLLKELEHHQDPLGLYFSETIQSYIYAIEILENAGTPQMTQASIKLYGEPGDKVPGSRRSHSEAARHFIKLSDRFWRIRDEGVKPAKMPAEAMRAGIQDAVDLFFSEHQVQVVLDPSMSAKAAASAKKIRLKAQSNFGPMELPQLLAHEAFVHTLTAINGAEQPFIKSLGLSAPRTTLTQEGLATFAEMVCGAMDIGRLKRIALRIIAVEMGLKGADFIEIFKMFADAGQSYSESFHSTARIFRGGNPTGGVIFTKDNVYLAGLLSAHLFFRWSMHEKNLRWIRYLFCGRLSFKDAVRLEPYFASGLIKEPHYLPTWIQNEQSLAAYLAFSIFADNLPISGAYEAFGLSPQKARASKLKSS